MKKSLVIWALTFSVVGFTQNIKIQGIIDGPLSGGTPKMLELYVMSDVPDLSVYGVDVASNDGVSGGQDFALPAGSASAGDHLYFSAHASEISTYFEMPGITINNNSISVNGNDAVVLYFNGTAYDVYGYDGVNPVPDNSDYLDSTAYRNAGATPTLTFNAADWDIPGPNSLDGCTLNSTCGTSYPLGTLPVELLNFSVE